MKTVTRLFLLASLVVTPAAASAQVEVIGGFTSVALDTDTLAAAASLTLSSVSPGIGAGVLPDSVAFPINSRGAASLPTTFAYTPGSFPNAGTFSGTIEHTGSVFFNTDTVEVGNFTIGFDAGRAVDGNSGFFVESTTGVSAILFDTQVTGLTEQSETLLDLSVDLVVSSEFAQFLQDNALASSDLTGADVGDARIQAVVPEPTAALLALLAACGVATRRR